MHRLILTLLAAIALAPLCRAEAPSRADVYFMEAQRRAALGDNDGYHRLMDRLWQLDPDPTSVQAREVGFWRLQSHSLRNDSAEIARAYRMVQDYVDANPSDSYSAVTLAQIHQQFGRYDDALTLLARADSLTPRSPSVAYRHAMALNATGRFRESVQVLQRIRRNNGTSPDLTYTISQLLLTQLCDTAGADAEIRLLTDDLPTDPDALTLASAYYSTTGRPQLADSMMLTAMQAHPGDIGLLCFYIDEQTERDSIAGFQRAVDTVLSSPLDDYELKSFVYQMIQTYEDRYPAEIATLCRNILRDSPDIDIARFYVANYEGRYGDRHEAETILRALIADDPDTPFYHTELVRVLALQDKDTEALSHGYTVLRDTGNTPYANELRYLMAIIHLNIDQPDKALALLETLSADIDDTPDNAEELANIWRTIADTRQSVGGDVDQAYQKALETLPDDHLALNNYAYYLAEQNRDLDRALSMAERALALSPNSPTYLDTLAWVLYRQGKPDAALAIINQAIEAADDRQNDEMQQHKAAILKAL